MATDAPREALGPGSPVRRFAVVGVLNTAVDLVLFGVLTAWGVGFLVANVFSTSAGMTSSFLANRGWTFQSSVSVRRSIGPFMLATASGLWVVQPLVIALVLRGFDRLGGDSGLGVVWFAKAVAIGVGMVWNFLWYRWVVFVPAEIGHAAPESRR